MIRISTLLSRPIAGSCIAIFAAIILGVLDNPRAQAGPMPLPREKPAPGASYQNAAGQPLPRPNPFRAGKLRALAPLATGIGIEQTQNQTRFILNLTRDIPYRIFTLADPYRVVIDFPEIGFKFTDRADAGGGGLIKAFRYGLFRPGNSRAVLDLNQPARIVARQMLPPRDGFQYRLVLDLVAATRADFLKTAGWPDRPVVSAPVSPGAPTPVPPAKPEPASRLVVIDPGHGGIDPGASSPDLGLEKTLALRFARTLADELNQNYPVRAILTRDHDVFLPLRERVEFARAKGADLFISIHADTLPSPQVSGASVYTLSDIATDEEAAELAAGENQADIIAGVDLQGEEQAVASILINLAQRETNNRSIDFALLLVDDLRKFTPVLPTGHRQAGFRVLKAPDIPSILLELGFISNRQDANRLKSLEWRRNTAHRVAASISRWLVAEPP